MIRRSLLIACVALALSLVVHLMGIGVFVRVERAAPPPEGVEDVAALGNSFEEIADVLEEPDTPEPVEPVEPTPPSEAEVPDTEVLVASENPVDSYAPDTGTAQIVEPVPLAGTQSDFVAQPDVQEPTAAAVADEPVTPTTDVLAPIGAEVETDEPVDPVEPEVAETPREEVIASLPDTLTPVVPVSPLVDPDTEVVQDPEVIEPVEDAPEETVEDSPEEKPKPLFPGWKDGFEELRSPTETVESPLETYRREGAQAFAGGFGIQSGSAANSRGPGNASTTNYAGRGLVHLNRTRPVHVKADGWARVFFEISPDGQLNWVEVVDGSGNADVDRAARVQIQRGAPFPKPPNGERRQLSFWYRSR